MWKVAVAVRKREADLSTCSGKAEPRSCRQGLQSLRLPLMLAKEQFLQRLSHVNVKRLSLLSLCKADLTKVC